MTTETPIAARAAPQSQLLRTSRSGRWRAKLWRLRTFARIYRAVVVAAVAISFDAEADVSKAVEEAAANGETRPALDPAPTSLPAAFEFSDQRPGAFIGFELAGGSGATTSMFADSAARRASSAFTTGVATAAFGWGKKDGASYGVVAEMLNFGTLAPTTGQGLTYAGAGFGPFVRLGHRRLSLTTTLAVGAFDHYGERDGSDAVDNGYGDNRGRGVGADDSARTEQPTVSFASLRLGAGFALVQTPSTELALTAALMPVWTDAPHGPDALARRMMTSELGLALNFFPRPDARPFGDASFFFDGECFHRYSCSDLTLRGTKALLDLGAAASRGLADGLVRALLRH